jgi:hypothetical protein
VNTTSVDTTSIGSSHKPPIKSPYEVFRKRRIRNEKLSQDTTLQKNPKEKEESNEGPNSNDESGSDDLDNVIRRNSKYFTTNR